MYDFGASRLFPSNQSQVTTIVRGTFGYLDPEYMHTGPLTEKSDVYSFGVVLIELLIGQKVVCYERLEEKKFLATYFVYLMKIEWFLEGIDPIVLLNDGNVKHLKEIAALASGCMRMNRKEMPTMKEVAHEIAGLQAKKRHHWSKKLVPLEGDEEGVGSFVGSICSQYSLGNLDAFERTMKARRVKNKHLFLQETNMFDC
ncbi:hypothetical protein REPUB_Repub02eG0110300 [Reevesia pubescens]